MQRSVDITTASTSAKQLAFAVLILLGFTLASLIAAHIAQREVKPLRDAVSDYGVRGNPWFYRAAVAWIGFASLLLAVIFATSVYPKPSLTILLLLIFAGTRWAITIYPVDLEGAEPTPVGRTHTVLASVAFGALALAAVSFASETAGDPFWADGHARLTVLAVVVPVLALATAAARALKSRWFGLVERLFYVAMISWLATPAILLLSS